MALYNELIDILIDRIKKMKIGEKLPSERQLCIEYNVSRTTVRSAILELELKGYLKRYQGKGTFVSNPQNNRQNLSNYYSFTEQTKKLGKIPKSVILEFYIGVPADYILRNLGLKENSYAIKFNRLRLANNEKMMLETTYIPYDSFKDITRPLLDRMPLYEIFDKKYNKKIVKVNEIFSVTLINQEQSDILDVVKGSPALKINRTSYDSNGNVIEYTISYASGDKFIYETNYFPN